MDWLELDYLFTMIFKMSRNEWYKQLFGNSSLENIDEMPNHEFEIEEYDSFLIIEYVNNNRNSVYIRDFQRSLKTWWHSPSDGTLGLRSMSEPVLSTRHIIDPRKHHRKDSKKISCSKNLDRVDGDLLSQKKMSDKDTDSHLLHLTKKELIIALKKQENLNHDLQQYIDQLLLTILEKHPSLLEIH